MQACTAALRAERARIAGRVRPAENVRAASRRTAGATFARTRWLACMQRADALASMHAARSARGCVCGGMRTNTSFEIQAPGVRSPQWVHHRSLPPDVPALPPSTVLSSLCPVRSPASPHPRPPPSLPESSPPRVLGLEFHLFLVRKAAIFVLCSEKMEECTVSKKEASSCHTSNTKLKEFDMTRMTNF